MLWWHVWSGRVVGEDRRFLRFGVVEPSHGEKAEREGVAGGGDALLQVEPPCEESVDEKGEGDAEASSKPFAPVATVDGNVDNVDVERPVFAAARGDGPTELRPHRAASQVEVSVAWCEV